MSSEQTFRSAKSSYVILGGTFAGLLASSIYGVLVIHPSFWKAVASFGAAFVVVMLWLMMFDIRITSDELVFRSLLRGVRRVRHRDIRKIRLGFDLANNGGPLRLYVESSQNDIPPMSINAKVFSSEAIRAVLDLGARVASADSGGLERGLTVAGHRFEYSDFNMTPGFRRSRARGGPFGPGIYVRLRFSGNDILYAEVCDPMIATRDKQGGPQ